MSWNQRRLRMALTRVCLWAARQTALRGGYVIIDHPDAATPYEQHIFVVNDG